MAGSTERLAVEIPGLSMASPFMVASSVLTGDMERIRLAHAFGAGGLSSKMAVPASPPVSSPAVILRRRDGGIITPGDKRLPVDQACRLIEQIKEETGLAVMGNVFASVEDLAGWQRVGKALEEAGADALELDISCPNIPMDMRVGSILPAGDCVAQHVGPTEEVTRAVVETVSIPVYAKLTAQVSSIVEIARACEREGAAGVVAINALRAAPPLDIWNGGRAKYLSMDRHNLGSLTGGPLFPLACRAVADIARETELAVIGCGGVSRWEQAVEMMMWGASAIQVCTAVILKGFDVIDQMNRGLESYLDDQGLDDVSDLVGVALEHMASPSDLVYGRLDLEVDHECCNMCGACLEPGICVAISAEGGRIELDNELCIDCGTCVQICPRGAIRSRGGGHGGGEHPGDAGRQDRTPDLESST